MANFCSDCGSKLTKGQKFCTQCGVKIEDEALAETAQRESFSESSPSFPGENPISYNSLTHETKKSPPPPPPPDKGKVFVFAGPKMQPKSQRQKQQIEDLKKIKDKRAVTKEGGTQPPSSETYEFQDETMDASAQIISRLDRIGLSAETGFGRLLARMIRASLLNKTIYLETLADTSLNKESWQIIGVVIALSSLGTLTFFRSFAGIMSVISSSIVQLIAWFAWVWVVQIGSNIWFKVRLEYHQVFRPMAYAQSPGVLQIVPVVGQIVSIWRLVTSTVCIRDITSCSTFQAMALALIGFIAAMLATYAAAPIVNALF